MHDSNVLLLLVGMVGVLLVAGVVSLHSTGSPTGHVIIEEDACSHCEGEPVCGARGKWVQTYDNSCVATCMGARVIADISCEQIGA